METTVDRFGVGGKEKGGLRLVEGGEEGGKVVAIPQRRLCSNCEHGALSTSGVYCTFFREPIIDETVAVDCGEFDPQPEAPVLPTPQFTGRLEPAPESSNDRLMIVPENLEELIDTHLEASYSTLWGEVFDVKSKDGRAEAVKWFAAEIRELEGRQS